MSKQGGKILNDLWGRVDQADYDTMIHEAFMKLPLKIQKKFIKVILENYRWDLDGKPDEETIKQYWDFCSEDGD